MLSPKKVSNANTGLNDLTTNKNLSFLKLKKVYVLLGFILVFTLATIALAASTLGIVIREDKTDTACDHGTFVCSINVDHSLNHLRQLQKIADESNGTRAIHTAGYNRTMDYVIDYLTSNTNLKVQTQFFDYNSFALNGNPTLSATINGMENSLTYGLREDFTYMSYSGIANFSSPIQMTSIPNLGCSDADWLAATMPTENRVALVKRGVCAFTDKSRLAERYRVAGLLIYNDGATAERNPPLEASIHQEAIFPALFLSYQAGMSLVNTANNPSLTAGVTIRISTTKKLLPVGNICAHTVTGDPTQTIVIGSHMDSVPAGPGINDNGMYSKTHNL